MMTFIKRLNLAQQISGMLIAATLILAAYFRSVEPLFLTVLLGLVVYWEEMLKDCKDCPESDIGSPTDVMS